MNPFCLCPLQIPCGTPCVSVPFGTTIILSSTQLKRRGESQSPCLTYIFILKLSLNFTLNFILGQVLHNICWIRLRSFCFKLFIIFLNKFFFNLCPKKLCRIKFAVSYSITKIIHKISIYDINNYMELLVELNRKLRDMTIE